MKWNIEFYESPGGRKPVGAFIDSLEIKDQAKIYRTIDLLKTFGNQIKMPYSKKISGRIYELRIQGGVSVRILYAFGSQRIVYLLHGFKKKGQKTPKSEIITARTRLDRI